MMVGVTGKRKSLIFLEQTNRKKRKGQRDSYKRITWLLESQVTWNQVQGLTSVGSQLCNTLLGSESLLLKACRAFPTQ